MTIMNTFIDTADIYFQAFKNESFVVLFAFSQIILYLGDHWAQNTKKYIGTQTGRNYFAETLLSFIHAVITSITCCFQLLFNTSFTRMIYSYSTSLSCAYFVMHGFNYLNVKGGDLTNKVLIIHHIVGFLAVAPISNLNGNYLQDSQCSNVVYFVSAGLHLVEISTIFMDIRIFSKLLWQNHKFYFVSTIGLVSTYFPLRCIWLGYLIYIILKSKNAFYSCFGHSALILLILTFGFIWLMSCAYSIIMLRSGTKLFKLKYQKCI